MAELIVYEHPLSPYAQKVKIALMEKGIPFEARLPEGAFSSSDGTTDNDFAGSSPRGEVPSLVEKSDEGDNVRIFDSTIILEYIEDRWPQPPMLPAEPLERARVRMLEDAMDTHFEAISWGLAEIHFFGRAEGALAAEIEGNAAKQVRGWYKWLSAQLGDRQWFNGDDFGWGDLSVVPYLNSTARFGIACEGALADWLARANARESVTASREAATAAGFASANMDAIKGALETGAFKREYRDHRLEWMIKSGGLSIVQEGLAKNNIRFTPVFD